MAMVSGGRHSKDMEVPVRPNDGPAIPSKRLDVLTRKTTTNVFLQSSADVVSGREVGHLGAYGGPVSADT